MILGSVPGVEIKRKAPNKYCSGGWQPPLVPRSLRALAMVHAGSFFCCIETTYRAGQSSYGEGGVSLDVIACGFPLALLLLQKRHCFDRSLFVLEAGIHVKRDTV